MAPSLQKIIKEEAQAFNEAIATSCGSPEAISLAVLLQNLTASCKTITRLQSLQVEAHYTRCERANYLSMPAICQMGYFFSQPISPLTKNIPHANFFYSCCIQSNNCPLAKYLLACNLQAGNGIQRNPPKALTLLEQVIRTVPSSLVLRRLARLHELGEEGVPTNPALAVRLYQSAITEHSSVGAMQDLADMYVEGRPGLPAHPTQARLLYEQALELSPTSRAAVGLAYVIQHAPVIDDAQPDLARAVALYEDAIDRDANPDALNNLALLLSQGAADVPKDPVRAAKLWEAASDKGNLNAKHSLARLFENGARGVEKDLPRTVELYEQIVDNERFKGVRFNLAWLLSSALEGVPQDISRAVELYQQVIDEDSDINAMFNLASLLSEARGGIERNMPHAISLYERAITEGDHMYSMHSLGVLLSSGNGGVERDLPRAVALLERAIEAGRYQATFDLALVLSSGDNGKPIDIHRAIQRYEEVIEKSGHMGAIINLSDILFEGKHGVQPDPLKAKRLCESAVAQAIGFETESLQKLGIIANNNDVPVQIGSERYMIQRHAVGQGWHLMAMCNLARMYMSEPVIANMDKAEILLGIATDDSLFKYVFQSQQLDLEGIFRMLKGMIRDPSKSSLQHVVRIFEILIMGTEDAHAMYILAELLMEGAAKVPQDVHRAVGLYKRACDRGDRNAMMALGEILNCGREVEPNAKSAFGLFARVLSLGTEHHLKCEAAVNMALIWNATKHKGG